jgi:high affinity Mn2+ porin
MLTIKHPVFALTLAITGLAFASYADDDVLASKFQALAGNTDPNQEDWSLHGQATEILQGYPSFPASYSGANSLSPESQWKNTTTATLFLGRRLWEGAEVYMDRELYEGKGLDDALGVAGFPNGEANKAGSWPIKTNDARLFIRQVIGLGGPTEQIAADQNQLAEKEDISRITFTAGKFAATDIFDNNSYTHDPRTQFLDWSLMDSAAWDYPANSRGYTNGLAAELNQEHWAVRYGVFMEPEEPNQSDLVFHGANNVGQVAELEERYKIDGNPGKLHFLVFYNRNREADYSDALGMPDVNAAIADARSYGGVKYGFAINAEQQLADGIGAFARLSWNNGQTEEWMFTDVSESAAIGLSLDGKRWEQEGDVWGIAGVINGISADQRAFLEQGGYGILIGDGQLSYSPEAILETYYSIKITQYAALTPDYQFIANPGYNTARGPVNVFSARLHVAF